jgi:uncharacterized protein (TIGR00251 family)
LREAFTPTPEGCLLRLRVHPGARLSAFNGMHADALKLSINTPPVDGRANKAVIAFVAAALDLPRSKCTLVAGQTSRSKTLLLTGISVDEAMRRLAASSR